MQPLATGANPATGGRGDAVWERRKGWIAYAVLIPTFCLLPIWLHPQYENDPLDYTHQVFAFLQRPGLAETRGILEFGHLIWRPAAVASTLLAGPAISRLMNVEPGLAPLVALTVLNAIFTFLAVLLVYRIARSLADSVLFGVLVALSFLMSNAVLTYMRSGFAYLPGVAMQLLAVSVIVAQPRRHLPTPLRSFILGCALAASICLWTPNLVAIPGLIALAVLWREGGSHAEAPRETRLRFALQSALWMAAVTGVAFGGAILLNQFRSWHEISDWIRNSSHEWAQTQRLVRLVTGLPRGFIAIRDESLMLKRLYFHDPYAPVVWTRVLIAIAWKPPLFAVAMAALGWILAKTAAGRRLVIAILCSWIPLIVFAVALFEPGSPERFLPGFALLFAGIAYAARAVSWRDRAAWTLGVFLLAMAAVNISSMTAAAREARDQNGVQRLEAFHKVWRSETLLVLLSPSDPIWKFRRVYPFHPLSRIPFRFDDAYEPARLRAPIFRQEFALKALSAWQRGGEVWISRRLVAERPQPDWGWVEGDNPGVRWLELSGFYQPLETDAEAGGEDGFLRVAANEANRLLLGPYSRH